MSEDIVQPPKEEMKNVEPDLKPETRPRANKDRGKISPDEMQRWKNKIQKELMKNRKASRAEIRKKGTDFNKLSILRKEYDELILLKSHLYKIKT